MKIRDVWNANLKEEVNFIKNIVDAYPYVAMDTEFPGTPFDVQEDNADFRYLKVKQNVNNLKLIQLGLTFFNEQGNLPTFETDSTEDSCIWQFNFREFDIERDRKSPESIQFLQNAGIDFNKFKEEGVDINKFGQLFMLSGVVLNDSVRWVTFDSKYDFGYLIKALTGRNLPETRDEFFQLMNAFFPVVYDVRFMINGLQNLNGGLRTIAQQLEVPMEGTAHQAGPDSLVTCRTFNKLRQNHFPGPLDQFVGIVFRLNS